MNLRKHSRIQGFSFLYFSEVISELVIKGSSTFLVLYSAYHISESELGTYNLVASLGTLLAGMYAGGWGFRIVVNTSRSINVGTALKILLSIFTVTSFVLLTLYIIFKEKHSSYIFIGLMLFNFNSLFGSLNEIVWGIKSKANVLNQYSRTKLLINAICGVSVVSIFVYRPNFWLLVATPMLWSLALLTVFCRSIMNIKKVESGKEKESLPMRKKNVVDTLKIVITGLFTMSTYVLDNLYIANKYGVSDLPSYAIAFAACSFIVGLIGTPLQRIMSTRQSQKVSYRQVLSMFLVILISLTLVSLTLLAIHIRNPNEIIEKSFILTFFFYPYAISRVFSLVLNSLYSRFGEFRNLFFVSFLQICIMLTGFYFLAPSFGLFGIALSTSIASVISTLYLFFLYRSTLVTEEKGAEI